MQNKRIFVTFFLFCLLWMFVLSHYSLTTQEHVYGYLENTEEGMLPPFFKPYGIYPAISISGSIGIGDFNNDGLLDVVESNDDFFIENFQINVFLQNATGSLAYPQPYATGFRPETLATGDLNNDLRDDIVVADFGDYTISVFLQSESGTMSPAVKYDTAEGPYGIKVADVNNDGLNDVVVSHWNAFILGVFLQQSDGTLNDMIPYYSPMGGWDDVAVGDLNNDGLTDVVKMSGQRDAFKDLAVYLQNQDGNLDYPIIIDLPDADMGNGVSIGDVTGDGLNDIVMSYGGNSPWANIAVFAQTDAGTLILDATYEAYEIPGSVALSDVNMDGKLDVVVTHAQWEKLSVHLQNSTGGLDPYSLYPLPYYMNHPTGAIAVGDINNDGLPDVAFAHYLGPAILYHNPIFTDQVFLPSIISNTSSD